MKPRLVLPSEYALDAAQVELLETYQDLLSAWNAKVNLVSRKLSREDLWQHIVHCLAFTARPFPPGARIVDWGTGGGLPAIPLAIALPEVYVVGVDATLKKVNAVNDMVARLGLTNAAAIHVRAEEFQGNADYSVSRATAPLTTLWSWHARVVGRTRTEPGSRVSGGASPKGTLRHVSPKDTPQHDSGDAHAAAPITSWPRGLLALKGGNLEGEIADLKRSVPSVAIESIPIEPVLGDEFRAKVLLSVYLHNPVSRAS